MLHRLLSVGLVVVLVAIPTVADQTLENGPPHMEMPGDPPAGRPATPPPGVVSVGPVVVRGGFESVQVNVDEFGNNIPGDAANEPSIAVDPTDPNTMAIGWRQFDTVNSNFRLAGWGYSQDGGWSWTFPGVLEPGEFGSDPVLDFDAEGDFYYYSLQPNRGPGQWACYLYKSFDDGVTWPQEVYARGGDKAWMAIDRSGGMGNGHIYLAWTIYFSCCPGSFTRSTDGGLTFMEPINVPFDPIWGTLTVGPGGEVYATGVAWPNTDSFVIAKSTNAQDPDATPSFSSTTFADLGGEMISRTGPNPGGLLGQAWIATDHSGGPNHGNVYLLCSVDPPGSDPLDVMFARSTDGGATWSPPVRVNDDPPGSGRWQWFGTMSVAPNGRIDVIWNDTRTTGEARFSELFYSFSADAGETWSENIPVSPMFDSHIGWPQQNKIGDYYDMISHDDAAHVAYAATFNGEQDVYYLRIEHATMVLPGSLEIVRGRHVSGDVPDLFASDDSRMVFQPGVTQGPDEPPIWLILDGQSPTDAPAELGFILETRVDTPGVTQRIELFNYDTGEFEEIDTRIASFNEDGVVEVTVDGDPSRFVDAKSGAIQAQLTWMPPPLVILFPWNVGIDQAVWTIAP